MQVQAKAAQKLTQIMSLNMLMWLTMLTLFAAILFLAVTIYLAIVLVLTPALAALLAGVSLLGLSALLATSILILTHTNKLSRKPAEPQSATVRTDNPAGRGPGERAQHWLGHNPGLAMIGAVAVGAVLSASPGLRRAITRTTVPIAAQLTQCVLQEFSRQR